MLFADQQKACEQDVSATFEHLLADVKHSSEQLHRGASYALSRLGKCIRSMLVYATGEMLGVPRQSLHIPSAAIELMHTYSLIHDDLPVMDNDAL